MRLIHLLAPRRCLACKKVIRLDEDGFCVDCRATVADLSDEHNDISGVEQVVSLFSYSGAVAYVLKRFKSYPDKEAAEWFAEKLSAQAHPDGIDAVVCVPRAEKGYNQSFELAVRTAKLINRPFLPDALLKRKGVKSQTKCHGVTERFDNVRHAYRPNKNVPLTGKRVLLIDDIFTTGATVTFCADALHRSGAVSVSVLTVAHRSSDATRNMPLRVDKNPNPPCTTCAVTASASRRAVLRHKLYTAKSKILDYIKQETSD